MILDPMYFLFIAPAIPAGALRSVEGQVSVCQHERSSRSHVGRPGGANHA